MVDENEKKTETVAKIEKIQQNIEVKQFKSSSEEPGSGTLLATEK